MQQTTKTTLIAVGAVVALSFLIAGVATLCSAPVPTSSEGFEGPLASIWQGMLWMGYLMLACGVALTLLLVACVLRMIFGAFGQLASGVEWLVTKIRDAWQPAVPALDTVMVVKNGKPITLSDILSDIFGQLRSEVKELKGQLGEVLARTAHIEPPPTPPPPKTAEEVAAEQAETIAALQRQLAEFKAQQQAKAVIQAAGPANAEVAP